MQTLATDFTDQTFRYTQIWREQHIALYRQEHKVSGGLCYEVVTIWVAPAHTWPNGTTSPEREVSPPASAWGTLAWTCFGLDAAMQLARTLRNQTTQCAPCQAAGEDTP